MTCSLEPEENEGMVGEALEAHAKLEVVRRDRRFPAEMIPFQEKTGWFRLLPSEETDGFSGVVIKKAEG
jgi:16S rRNA C967 or C1407 C5-methylase (RsmB/RsmF family)